jgi:hypothetical protein
MENWIRNKNNKLKRKKIFIFYEIIKARIKRKMKIYLKDRERKMMKTIWIVR